MTEAEALATLIDLADVTATQVTIWLSLTFAFLTASYFVGKTLSRFQCLVISGLYLFVSALYGGAIVMHAHAWVLLRAREQTILDEVWIAHNVIGWEVGIISFLVGGTLSSLIFLYSVRRTKLE